MANHLATRLLWTDHTDLLAAELADIDAKTTDSISATGGTYAVTEDMDIGADLGVQWFFHLPVTFYADAYFAADLGVGGDVDLYGNAYFQQTFGVSGAADFYGHAAFHDDASFSGNVGMLGSVVLGDTAGDSALVLGTLDVLPDATFESTLSVNGQISAFGDVYVDGTTHFNGPVECNAGGYIKKRLLVVESSIPNDVGPKDYDEVLIADTFVGAIGATFLIADDATVAVGASMVFVTKSTYGLTLGVSGGGGLALLSNSPGTTSGQVHMRRVDVRKGADGWYVLDGKAA